MLVSMFKLEFDAGARAPWIEKDRWQHQVVSALYFIGICNFKISHHYVNNRPASTEVIIPLRDGPKIRAALVQLVRYLAGADGQKGLWAPLGIRPTLTIETAEFPSDDTFHPGFGLRNIQRFGVGVVGYRVGLRQRKYNPQGRETNVIGPKVQWAILAALFSAASGELTISKKDLREYSAWFYGALPSVRTVKCALSFLKKTQAIACQSLNRGGIKVLAKGKFVKPRRTPPAFQWRDDGDGRRLHLRESGPVIEVLDESKFEVPTTSPDLVARATVIATKFLNRYQQLDLSEMERLVPGRSGSAENENRGRNPEEDEEKS